MKAILKILAWVGGIVGVIVLILYLTVIEFWTVPSDDPALIASIAPNLAGGDTVVVAKEAIPDTPELVRCTDPDATDRFVVGRVIARNTEPLTIIGDIANSKGRRLPSSGRCKDKPVVEVVTKDGDKKQLECWEENYAGSTFRVLRSGTTTAEDYTGNAEPGKFFLVSDNRNSHLDSRDFGQVEPRNCRRIYLRLWGAAGISEPHFEWLF